MPCWRTKTFRIAEEFLRFQYIPYDRNKRIKKIENHNCDFPSIGVGIAPKQIHIDDGIICHIFPPMDEEKDWDHITMPREGCP